MPNPTNPQHYNRYAYVNNRPIVMNDPTGHDAWWATSEEQAINYYNSMANTGGGLSNVIADEEEEDNGGECHGKLCSPVRDEPPPPINLTINTDNCWNTGNGGYSCYFEVNNNTIKSIGIYSSLFKLGFPLFLGIASGLITLKFSKMPVIALVVGLAGIFAGGVASTDIDDTNKYFSDALETGSIFIGRAPGSNDMFIGQQEEYKIVSAPVTKLYLSSIIYLDAIGDYFE